MFYMYNNYFREGMFISFKDSNIDAKITIVVDQIFPCVVKGRIVKMGKHGEYIFTNRTKTVKKKDCFCGWGNNGPAVKIEK